MGSGIRALPPNFMMELNDFRNDGFGWACRHCEREAVGEKGGVSSVSRLLSEGEAEGRQPRYANSALAKWADPARRILFCPKCGITELAEKS